MIPIQLGQTQAVISGTKEMTTDPGIWAVYQDAGIVVLPSEGKTNFPITVVIIFLLSLT